MVSEAEIDDESRAILRALATRKNVIISGPPGTGKSRLLNRVASLFGWSKGETGAAPDAEIPVPSASAPIPEWFPSPFRDVSRRVFPTVFDQNTKYRDFMRGLVPRTTRAVEQQGDFEVTSGTLYRAAIHASDEGNAALVIIDEINRGPAVAAFGSALVGLEPDKRLNSDGTPKPTTQAFEVLSDSAGYLTFSLPEDLYILAAMNEADTSVEPLDVAFLRRFAPYRLEPSASVLRSHFGLSNPEDAIPPTPQSDANAYEALVRAWSAINDQILLGRGQAYQLGHGALMHRAAPKGDLLASLEYVGEAWTTLRAHVDEVFYGNTRALSDVLRAEDGLGPYTVKEQIFAGQTARRIIGPTRPSGEEIYRLLRRIAEAPTT